MRLKSYFSSTVEGAMALARQELGPDAMLVNSRPTSGEARHLGDYEVVFATEIPGERTDSVNGNGAAGLGNDRLSVELAELKREIEGMRSALRRSAYTAPHRNASASVADAYSVLVAGDVSPDLARQIVEAAEARIEAPAPVHSRGPARGETFVADERFVRALEQEIESRFTVEPYLGRGEATPRIVALVGPPGAGKTTSLVKLAVAYGLVARRPVLLLSMDTYRVAAADQLRSYAAILGVGFQLLETVGALAQAIEENRGKELIFIDTPGLGPGDLDDSNSLARFLSTRNDIDTHLVLSSSMKGADVTRMTDAFEIFHPQRLLFTKLDETGSFGPILNEANRTGKPLSFLANGQRIPEDIEAASAERVTDLLLGSLPAAKRSAA